MSDRQAMIKELLAMQKKFQEYVDSQDGGFDMADYYIDDESHPLYNYRENYNELAMKIVDQAHEDRGSQR